MIFKLIVGFVVLYAAYRYLTRFSAAGEPQRPRGPKVTVKYDQDKAKSKTPDAVGEYVEFEDIEDSSK